MKYTHTRGHGGHLALRVRSSRACISALNRSAKLETLEFKQGRRQEQRERDLKIEFRVLEIIFVNYFAKCVLNPLSAISAVRR